MLKTPLTTPRAVVIAAAVIAVAMVRSAPPTQPYQFLRASDSLMVWRLDTRSGTGALCTFTKNEAQQGVLDCEHKFAAARP